MTELVGNFRRPVEGSSHVWLATRGPGEFVGKRTCSCYLSSLRPSWLLLFTGRKCTPQAILMSPSCCSKCSTAVISAPVHRVKLQGILLRHNL